MKIVDHLKNVHGVARSQVSGTYCGRQAFARLLQAARAKDDVGAMTHLDKYVKHDPDYMKQKNLPKVDVAKAAAKKAVLTPNFVCEAHRGFDELAPLARFMCNVLLAGKLQLNGFCGRSMD